MRNQSSMSLSKSIDGGGKLFFFQRDLYCMCVLLENKWVIYFKTFENTFLILTLSSLFIFKKYYPQFSHAVHTKIHYSKEVCSIQYIIYCGL